MTWEETIQFIRKQPEYKDLVELAYFEEDLSLNVDRFRKSSEFLETKNILSQFFKLDSSITLLDIGSGNGISCVSFALEGLNVTAVEPDPSNTIGAGAIRRLKDIYKLKELTIHQAFAEELKFADASFDIVYARQCLHHAYDLTRFVNECSRVLKPGGILFTVRDHVVFNEEDKKWFLNSHPLQKFYGGENAFSPDEYKNAIRNSGLLLIKEIKHFESVINHFPLSVREKNQIEVAHENRLEKAVNEKLKIFKNILFLKNLALSILRKRRPVALDEIKVPGRMYSFLAQKK